MALQYDVDPASGSALITGTGPITMSGMIAVVDELASDTRFLPHFTVILDVRKGRYTAELPDGDLLAAVLKQKRARFQNRFAVVVPESLHALARLYCLLTKMSGFDQIACFTDIDQARAWCEAPRPPP